MVKGFLNGTMGANRRNRNTGLREDAYYSRWSDMALVRSLRDRRVVRQVAVRVLQLHEGQGLWKGMPGYPTLPDVSRFGGPVATKPRAHFSRLAAVAAAADTLQTSAIMMAAITAFQEKLID